jgi:hypothetical protein
MDVSRRRFLRGGVAAAGAAALVGRYGSASQAKPLNGVVNGARDVDAICNMIRLNLFGEVLHCVGGPRDMRFIEMFLGINHGDYFTQTVRVESADITTTFLKTARGKTVTLYDDLSANRPYARMFRVEGTRGIWMRDGNKIYLRGISPADVWEDFGPYRERYTSACGL